MDYGGSTSYFVRTTSDSVAIRFVLSDDIPRIISYLKFNIIKEYIPISQIIVNLF